MTQKLTNFPEYTGLKKSTFPNNVSFRRHAGLAGILALSLVTATSAIAGGSSSTKNKNKNKGSNAVVNYVIDADCGVTVTSTKKIINVTITDADGNIIEKWDKLSSRDYTLPMAGVAVLTENTRVNVKSGSNGKRGKKNRGIGEPLPEAFYDELSSCLTSIDWGTCPCLDPTEDLTGMLTPRPWTTLLGIDKTTSAGSLLGATFTRNESISTPTSTRESIIVNDTIVSLWAEYDDSVDAPGLVFCSAFDSSIPDAEATRIFVGTTPQESVQAVQDCRAGLIELINP